MDGQGTWTSRLAEKRRLEKTGFSIGGYVSISIDRKNKPAYNSLHNSVLIINPVVFHLKKSSKIKINNVKLYTFYNLIQT